MFAERLLSALEEAVDAAAGLPAYSRGSDRACVHVCVIVITDVPQQQADD